MEKKQLTLFESSSQKNPEYITLSIEKIFLGAVIFIISIIISFILGVEKGKKKILSEKTLMAKKSETKIETTKKRVKEEAPEKNISTTHKYYTVQVASYLKRKRAKIEFNFLKKQGYEPILLEKGNYLVLCVGRFESKKEAKKILSELKKKYHDCFIRGL